MMEVEVREVIVGVEPCPEFFKSFVVIDPETSDAVVVDPGPAAGFESLLSELERLGVRRSVRGVIATHIHLDHYGAGPRLCRELGVKLYVHPRAVKHVVNPSKLWSSALEVLGDEARALGKPEPLPQEAVAGVGDGEVISMGSIDVAFMHTPGHAPHHIVAVIRGVVFVGDALGGYERELDVVFPTSPPGLRLDAYVESMERMLRSVRARYTGFTHMCLAHGFEDFVSRHARQLLAWIETIDELGGEKPSLETLASRDVELARYLGRARCDRILRSFEHSLEGVYSEWTRIRSSGGGEGVIQRLRSMIVAR